MDVGADPAVLPNAKEVGPVRRHAAGAFGGALASAWTLRQVAKRIVVHLDVVDGLETTQQTLSGEPSLPVGQLRRLDWPAGRIHCLFIV